MVGHRSPRVELNNGRIVRASARMGVERVGRGGWPKSFRPGRRCGAAASVLASSIATRSTGGRRVHGPAGRRAGNGGFPPFFEGSIRDVAATYVARPSQGAEFAGESSRCPLIASLRTAAGSSSASCAPGRADRVGAGGAFPLSRAALTPMPLTRGGDRIRETFQGEAEGRIDRPASRLEASTAREAARISRARMGSGVAAAQVRSGSVAVREVQATAVGRGEGSVAHRPLGAGKAGRLGAGCAAVKQVAA